MAPAWLSEIDRPIVLVKTSSEFQDDHRLAQAALDGLAGEDVFVVVTVPAGDEDIVEIGERGAARSVEGIVGA